LPTLDWYLRYESIRQRINVQMCEWVNVQMLPRVIARNEAISMLYRAALQASPRVIEVRSNLYAVQSGFANTNEQMTNEPMN
jgi:hypothetical protein